MRGIAGIIGIDRSGARSSTVAQMGQMLRHDPIWAVGSLSNEGLGLSVAWVSREKSGCVPSWNETRDICIVFVGQNFAAPGESAHPKTWNGRIESGDGGYLAHLYEKKGLDFLADINGRFCGLLLDLRESKAVLFNDRYGLGRIYYHDQGDTLYFSSEAKSLLKILPDLRKFDPSSLGEFFSCGCTLRNKSLFADVSILPGGAKWEFRPEHPVKKELYFRKDEWENQPILSHEDYYEKLRSTFARILPRYFQGDNGVGISLTGGLDSRMIMAWATRFAGKLPCYTFGGVYRDCADVKLGRSVAEACQQPYETIRVGREFLREFPALAEKTIYVSDGTMDVSGSVELYVNRFARQIAGVRLTGNYGSEVLRGHVAFKPISLYEALFQPELKSRIGEAANVYADEARDRRQSFILFKQVPWHHYARLSVEQSILSVRTPYLDNDLTRLIYQAPPDAISNAAICMRLVADGNRALTRFETDRALSWNPRPVVSKMRNAYQEVTFRAEYMFDYGMPQWLSRIDHLLAPVHWEGLFLGRHKFYHFRVWYRDELSAYVREVLLDPRTLARPYLCGRTLERIVTEHLAGKGNYTLELHRVLTTELIQRLLMEDN
jgi:asparagine synthase (glutamine-hydrolysing)